MIVMLRLWRYGDGEYPTRLKPSHHIQPTSYSLPEIFDVFGKKIEDGVCNEVAVYKQGWFDTYLSPDSLANWQLRNWAKRGTVLNIEELLNGRGKEKVKGVRISLCQEHKEKGRCLYELTKVAPKELAELDSLKKRGTSHRKGAREMGENKMRDVIFYGHSDDLIYAEIAGRSGGPFMGEEWGSWDSTPTTLLIEVDGVPTMAVIVHYSDMGCWGLTPVTTDDPTTKKGRWTFAPVMAEEQDTLQPLPWDCEVGVYSKYSMALKMSLPVGAVIRPTDGMSDDGKEIVWQVPPE